MTINLDQIYHFIDGELKNRNDQGSHRERYSHWLSLFQKVQKIPEKNYPYLMEAIDSILEKYEKEEQQSHREHKQYDENNALGQELFQNIK